MANTAYTPGLLLNLSSNNPTTEHSNNPFTYEDWLMRRRSGQQYQYIDINAEIYTSFVQNSNGCAFRLGMSDSYRGSALSMKQDKWLFNHVLGVNMGFASVGTYKVYFYYETQAITVEEATQEMNFINQTIDTLRNQLSAICTPITGLQELVDFTHLEIFIYSDPSGRTSSLTNTQRDNILKRFLSYSTNAKEIGIYCTYSNYQTMSLSSSKPNMWIIDYDANRTVKAVKDEVFGKGGDLYGVQKNNDINYSTFVNRMSGSQWLKETGQMAKYVLPRPPKYAIYADFPGFTNGDHYREAYCTDPLNSLITLYMKDGEYTYTYYDYTLRKNITIELIEGVHYDLVVEHVGFSYDKIVPGCEYPNEIMSSVELHFRAKGLFHQGEIITVHRTDPGGSPLNPEYPNAKFSKSPYMINDYVELAQTSYNYTGRPITVQLKKKNFANNFFDVDDFVISKYENNTNPGTATVYVVSKYGDVYGTEHLRPGIFSPYCEKYTFRIEGGTIEGKKVYLDGKLFDPAHPIEYYYTGADICPVVTIEGVPSDKFTCTYFYNHNPGTAQIVVDAIAPYIGRVAPLFNIVKEPISHYPVMVTPDTKTFSGEPITDVTVSVTSIASDQYTYSITNNVNIGFATVTVTAKSTSKYSGSTTGKFKIVEKDVNDIEVELEFDEDGNMFTGFKIEPGVKFLNIENIEKDKDYTIEYKDNVFVNSEFNNPRVIITGMRNLKGVKEVPFEILKRDIISIVYAYTTNSLYPNYNFEGPRSAYYVNDTENIYYLDYPNDILVTETRSEWVEDPYRSFFRFYQKYIGQGNFDGEFEYEDNITFDPSDPGTFDYGLDDYYGDQWPQWSVDPPPSDDPSDPSYDPNRGDLQNQRPGRVKPDESHWDFGIQSDDYSCKPDERYHSEVVHVYNMNKDEPGDLYRYDFNVISGDPDNPFEEGREFILEPGTPVFVEAYSILPFDHREGSHIVYDSLIVNNRIKMTDSSGNARKAGKLVCWVNISDLNKIGILAVGDKVLVNGKLYKDPSGGGGYVEKFNTVMHIVKVVNTSENEYPYGLATYATSEIIGYANADSVEEIAD